MKDSEILRNFKEIQTRLSKLEGIISQLTTDKNTPQEILPDLNVNLETENDNDDFHWGMPVTGTRGLLRHEENEGENSQEPDIIYKIEIEDCIDTEDRFFEDDNDDVGLNSDPLFIPENEEDLSESDRETLNERNLPPPSKIMRKAHYSPLQLPPSVPQDGPVVKMERLASQPPLKYSSHLPQIPIKALLHHCPESKCHFASKHKHAFNQHLRSHSKTQHKCPHCHRSFNKRDNMQRHILTHTGERPFPCLQCPAKFRRNAALKRHILALHSGRTKTVECPHCHIRWEGKVALYKHLQKYHVDLLPKLQCQECPYSTPYRGFLNVHNRTHTGERPFPCPHCKAKFRTNDDLKRHTLAQHSGGIKRFQCPQCQSFRTNLPHHLQSHLDNVHEQREKKWLCDQCSKAFLFKNQLNRHVQNVHENVELNCYFCQKKFKTSLGLTKHFSKHTTETSKNRKKIVKVVEECGNYSN